MSTPRRLVIPRTGPPEVLRVEPFEPDEPGPGQVRVRVHFAGINFADLLMRLGIYRPKPVMPFTPGYEGSGLIEALGPGVTELEVGQRVVFGLPAGCQQSHVVAPTEACLVLPDGIELDTAAATPVTYLTAWHMLVHLGNLQPGDSLLVHGAAGGVGTAALQIAQLFEAGLVLGTASAPKADLIRELGGEPIDYASEDFVEVVKERTRDNPGGPGVLHVLDPIGGAHLKRSQRCLASGGRLYAFGFSEAAPGSRFQLFAALLAVLRTPKLSPTEMMLRNQGLFGVHMGTLEDRELMTRHLTAIVRHIARAELAPVIDSIHPIEAATAAHAHIHARKNRGKVLLDLR